MFTILFGILLIPRQALATTNSNDNEIVVVDPEDSIFYKQLMAQLENETLINPRFVNVGSSGVYKPSIWTYSSGTPSTTYNGTLWYKKIEFYDYDLVAAMAASMNTSANFKLVKGAVQGLASKGLTAVSEAGKKYITEQLTAKFGAVLAANIAKYVSVMGWFYSGVTLLTALDNYYTASIYQRSVDNKCGLMVAKVDTSYNGRWSDGGKEYVLWNSSLFYPYAPKVPYVTGVYK